VASAVTNATAAEFRFSILHRLILYCLILIVALLAGCKTDIYTKRTEGEANEMVSVLMAQGIAVDKKSTDAGKTWNIAVDEGDVVAALAVLRAEGLPQEKHVNLGELFKKEGIISSPTEERVRFMHGVTQELSSTLTKIDGVIVARVHVVLPNNDPLAQNAKPSSASVFVKYRPEHDVPSLTAAIKNLVARSVEGLAYENVSVTLVPGTPAAARTGAVPRFSNLPMWLALGGMFFLVLLAVAAGAIVLLKPAWVPDALRQRIVAILRPTTP
jgi:type III secretion protein J